jgi:hypothetical protein
MSQCQLRREKSGGDLREAELLLLPVTVTVVVIIIIHVLSKN